MANRQFKKKSKRTKGLIVPESNEYITLTELKKKEPEFQYEIMKHWFFQHFEDPVNCCPYISREGGYQFLYGGPYDAEEELLAKFGDFIDEDLIIEVAGELFDICYRWSGNRNLEFQVESNYDDVGIDLSDSDFTSETSQEISSLIQEEVQCDAFSMKFESIKIKNFRNFEDIELKLANKNIFFGLNDVGKTNFLYALRYVFDKDIRRLNLIDSDFYNKNVDIPIEITITLDISDIECSDCQKLRAQLKGSLLSKHDKVYICLRAEYDKQEMLALPILYWGGNLEKLQEMKQRGYMYELDYVFNVIYIDSYVDLYSLFKKNINTLVKNECEEDKGKMDKIQSLVNSLNTQIASLSGIKDFEEKIAPEYKKFRNEDIAVSIESEIAVKGLYSNIIPYIKQVGNDNLYPTAGEGRKKLLAYSIYDLLADESAEKKINLFLVEEPENHLHKSMQISLSQILFTDSKYKYLFVSTHSPFVLYEMDNVNLIRIYSDRKINSASRFYKIPDNFEKNRKMLNRSLSEAIFADKVLLVEGPSDQLLFEKVLTTINPFYEADGIYILTTGGIGFEAYFTILDALKIDNVIKTDNDLRRAPKSGNYSVLGFFRCNNYIGEKLLPTKKISENTVDAKRALYDENRETLDEIRSDYKIYLSKTDLENDLDEVLHEELVKYLGDDPVKYLNESKHYNMVELIGKISDADCRKIYNHYNFACLKAVVE